MLRRIKKDVENELTDKVEVLVYCPLTIRQKLLYVGLKRKIRIEELLQNLGSQSQINSSLKGKCISKYALNTFGVKLAGSKLGVSFKKDQRVM